MKEKLHQNSYMKGFIPYALASFLIGIVGGFSTVLGPAFVRDMNLPYNNTTWTALATAMSSAACAPILGKLQDVLGRKTALLLGIAIFGIGNLLNAIAPSLPFMLFARFVVGIGIAAIAPVVIAYIITEFPSNAMAKGFSLYMLISSGAVIFGPTLGGMVLETANWRILMWICFIISLLTFAVCFFLLRKNVPDNAPLTKEGKELNDQSSPANLLTNFDLAGAVFVVLFFSLLLCIPSFGQNFGWDSTAFLIVLFLALLTLAGLITVEKHAKQPILQGSFIKQKSFLLSVAILFLTQGLMQANMTNTIVFINYTQPENSIISGYAISIMYLGMSLGAILLGPLADRFEPKKVLTASLILTGIGCSLMLLYSTSTSLFLLAAALGILGFGLGGNGTIFMKIVLSGIAPDSAGTGTGIYGLFRELSAPFGVAVFVPMFTNQITRQMTELITENPLTKITAASAGALAAVDAIRTLAFVETGCILIGILLVQFLPRIHTPKKHEA